LLFKKTDSLLRGHPGTEIAALLQLPRWQRAILCPANPARGRTIDQGHYYVAGTRLTQSALADDPEYPRTTDDVYAMLQTADAAIAVPDVTSPDDLQTHASQLAAGVLPAGGAEFFAAILRQQANEPPSSRLPPLLPTPWCFVCGSRTGWQQGRLRSALDNRIPCHFVDTLDLQAFKRDVQETGAVWLAIGEPAQPAAAAAWLERLVTKVALCLETFCQAGAEPGTLFLEGGATARAVFDRCGWSEFDVVGELEPGCVALRSSSASAPRLVAKPGSYPWPAHLWTSRSPHSKQPSDY
jgi:hypothetical protein